VEEIIILEKLHSDISRLKESIYKNKVFISPSEKQEEAFYKMVKSFVFRLDKYMKSHNEKAYVKSTIDFMEKMQEKYENTRVSYQISAMEETIEYFYDYFKSNKEDESNFVASIDYSVFYSIRVIVENLYRYLTGNIKDETLNIFFDELSVSQSNNRE